MGSKDKKRKEENLVVLPTDKKNWYKEMVTIQKAGRLHKLVFIRNFGELEEVKFTHENKDKEMGFTCGIEGLHKDGFGNDNLDLRLVRSVATDGPAAGKVQVNDII